MGYVGDKLQPFFAPGPTQWAVEAMAEEGSEDFKKWVQKNTPIEIGTLRKSWYLTPMILTTAGTAPGRKRGLDPAYVTWLRTEVEYAAHVEWGTGIWGPDGQPYPITPKEPGGMLTWIDVATGNRIFAARVEHPGSPGQHMMAIGAAMAEHHFPRIAAPILVAWKLQQEALVR